MQRVEDIASQYRNYAITVWDADASAVSWNVLLTGDVTDCLLVCNEVGGEVLSRTSFTSLCRVWVPNGELQSEVLVRLVHYAMEHGVSVQLQAEEGCPIDPRPVLYLAQHERRYQVPVDDAK